jgi:cytidylate kinase
MPIITIARQFGAGGSSVGQMVARKLKADLLDRQLIAEVARRLELPEEDVEAQDEQLGSFLSRLLIALGSASPEPSIQAAGAAWAPPYADPAFDPRRAVLEVTQQVIKEAARSGNVVIIGRGSAYILRDLEGALHVFLRAAEETRVKTLMERFTLAEEDARRRMKQTDANRTAYIRQVYGHDWTHPSHYDVVLDSGRLGYDATADVILAALPGRSR